MNRRTLVTGSLLLALTASSAVGVVLATPRTVNGEIDLPYVNTRIDNLDARTTNNESDITALQASTGTAAADHVTVPAAPVAVAPTQPTLALEPAPSTAPPETVAVVFVPYTEAMILTEADGSQRLQCVYHPSADTRMLSLMPRTYDVSLGCPAQ